MERTQESVLENLAAVRRRMAAACDRAARAHDSVRLVAIGKSVEPGALRWVREAGVEDLGENYVRELRAKHDAVPDARWHFVGTLQSGGAHHVADLADVVETLVPGRAMARLARRCVERGKVMPSLVEVDLTEGRRAGVGPAEVAGACDRVASTDGLALRGLMTVPPVTPTAEEARPYFQRLRELQRAVAERHPEAVELSMGMSLDYEVAVEEGATMIRIGTALFGARPLDQGRT